MGLYSQADFRSNVLVDPLLTLFFYANIIWYWIYCRFIAEVTFDLAGGSQEYILYRNLCIEGAYYELM